MRDKRERFTAPAMEEVAEQQVEEVVEETVEEVTEELIQEESEDVIGFVSGCRKLRVREAANANARVLCEISEHSEISINKTESTDEFYKVCTGAGVEGFCMKKYITIG